MKDESVLVVFGEKIPRENLHQYGVVISPETLRKEIEKAGSRWKNLDDFVEPGSIYDASNFAEELPHVRLSDGTPVAKSFLYKGYELWWTHYDSLFLYLCLPYTQYKKLLEHLTGFSKVTFYDPPYQTLFSNYLETHGCNVNIIRKSGLRSPGFLPFGIFLQLVITLFSLLVLIVRRCRIMVFIGDKFEKGKDYDFRKKFIYKELRERELPFVEFIRSLEPWRTVVQHALIRRRPVIYSESIAFVGRILSIVTGGRMRRRFHKEFFRDDDTAENRFKRRLAIGHLLKVHDDVWGIRIMRWVLSLIGVEAAFIPAATERNFHAVLGCKLNDIPTVGILHGVASRYYNGYDFLPGFDGEKILSVDEYGLWSKWWKNYYIENSDAYKPEQLYVSGPMRPLQQTTATESDDRVVDNKNDKRKVLLVSEMVAVPQEVLPYLEATMACDDFEVYIKFRPHRDNFEEWLTVNHPEILDKLGEEKLLKGDMQDAVSLCDVVIGSQSTGVLEAVLQLKPFVFFQTKKWGDYYNIKDYDDGHSFFAENTEELVRKIRDASSIKREVLEKLRERYFGDPYKNGGAWVVDRLEKALSK